MQQSKWETLRPGYHVTVRQMYSTDSGHQRVYFIDDAYTVRHAVSRACHRFRNEEQVSGEVEAFVTVTLRFTQGTQWGVLEELRS